MTEYLLFYKHYNIAWGKINFSFIILPDGSLYYFNSPNDYLDILGFKKDNISLAISKNELNNAIENGQKHLSNKILNIDIKKIKPIKLQEDKSLWMSDSGFELYALFKYNSENDSYQYIPLKIFENCYFKAPKNQIFQGLVSLIDSYKLMISDKIETKTIDFAKNDLDDDTYIGKKI